MTSHEYYFGPKGTINQLFPPAKYANPDLNLQNFQDVIRHYTINSLNADGIEDYHEVFVELRDEEYYITITGTASHQTLETFGKRHAEIFSEDYATKAIKGKELLLEFNVWNPMKNYHVNSSPTDGTSKWHLFPPLGLNIIGQKGLLLLHYPPWAVIQGGTFENAITMTRWGHILNCAGISNDDTKYYKTFIDINPIAAPGSGESEYPVDYFPIMMASAFFDSPEPSDRDYIKSMLELYLTPPGWPEDCPYTLPILIGGSPLYDPQSPGWFRSAYTDILPQDENGIPQVNVLQAGKFKVWPHSKRETPYMIANHMIAAGVTGECTDDASKIPDIRQYEAQDLVAATFLKLYGDNPSIDPDDAKARACERWYGNKEGKGVPYPKNEDDRTTICALAQMDLFFEAIPKPHPKYTFEEAWERCKHASIKDDPCYGNIKPPPNKVS
jgi:hypothetical protein